MHAQLALILIQAALVTVEAGHEGDCPSSRQIADALQSRLPGLLIPFDQAMSPGVLRLALRPGATGAPASFTLTDQAGQVRLRRTLATFEGAPLPDCPALAETVALMVERYFQELDYPVSPQRTAGADPTAKTSARAATGDARPFDWNAFVGTSWRHGHRSLGGKELHIGGGRVLGETRSVLLVGSLGITGSSDYKFPWGTASTRSVPANLEVLWRASAGRSWLEVGVAAGFDLMSVTASGRAASPPPDADSQSVHRALPSLAGVAAARFWFDSRLFARLTGYAGGALTRYEFVGGGEQVAFGTPRLYLRLGLQLGTAF